MNVLVGNDYPSIYPPGYGGSQFSVGEFRKLIFRKKSFPIQNWKNSGQPEILNHHNLESPENRRIERETLNEGVHKFALRNSNI